ncbi:helix-turn-helix domain-containing protein [Caenimonas sedimenti]|uniref:Helix-turn-helix domain-containing protein n=1 Tax=Caenimonas sedimenti TaxID=2596921 RepID=A0A562ZQ22_9BURK|nr:response regulator transcription factor [Caenimonas sedimenti]TWO70264.1 helix-turn-helix domain-containing protein [Caenimonas sedimenti]
MTRTTAAVRSSETEKIVASIYDAALEPQRWTAAMGLVAGAIAADSSFFFSTHSDVDPKAVVHMFNHAPEMPEEFGRFWHSQDPWALAAQRRGLMKQETLVVGSELVAPGELRRTAFYNEFSRQHDIHSMVGTVLFDGHDTDAMPFTNLVWHRRPGVDDFSFSQRDRLRPLLPHFRRALRVQRRIGWLADQRSHEAFSAMHIASIVLDRAGAVLQHNAAGAGFLATLPPDCFRFGRLRALGTRCAPSVAEALGLARRGTPARIKALLPNDPPQVISASLLRVPEGSAHGPPVVGAGECFLLLVELPRAGGREVAQSVATLFQLSPAEVRVLGGLLDGRTPAGIGEESGSAISTVRSQISSLLAKTGCASQSELLVLLRGMRL